MSTHTPGPWTVSHDKKHGQQRISANDAPIAVTKDEANARLIAAAPELLAALQEIIDIKDNGGGLVLGRIEAVARAAIAKAEGVS